MNVLRYALNQAKDLQWVAMALKTIGRMLDACVLPVLDEPPSVVVHYYDSLTAVIAFGYQVEVLGSTAASRSREKRYSNIKC